MDFGTEQGGKTVNLRKNDDQERVEDIQIGPTRDEMTENEQTGLKNEIRKISGLDM